MTSKQTTLLNFICLLFLSAILSNTSFAQTTTLLTYGFEAADPTWTYSLSSGVTLARLNDATNANTGTWSAFYDGANGVSNRINGSVITPSLTFDPGYLYTITVFAKTNSNGAIAGQNPTFKIARATTATNAAMAAAAGAELLLNTTLSNTTYGTARTASFTVSSSITRFIGFQAVSTGFNFVDVWIDDILITKTCNISSNAGPDQVGALTCGLTQVTLAGNTIPTGATGSWSVVSGTGGAFGNASSPTSTFSGTSGSAYTLQWSVSLGACTNVTDNVDITFNKAPVITCPSNIAQCDNHVVAYSTPTATGTPSASINCIPASGSTFATGTTTVNCTATNFCGSSTCSFSVTVNTTPVIGACPSNIVQCDNHVVNYTAPSSTAMPAASMSCIPASGSTFATGTTAVTCTATNLCGSSSCSFNVTINESPVIGSCPTDIVQCDNPVASWTNPSSTGTPAASIICSPPSGSTFVTGTTTVNCSATNSCGSSTCSFSVTINTTPVIGACPSNIVQCDNHVVNYTAPSSTATPAASMSCSPASGSTFATGTTAVTCTATNLCGSSSCSFNVTINDSPVIGSCPTDIVQCDGAIATWTDPAASGSPAASVICSPASGSTFAAGTTAVTCIATNSCSSSSCSFNVTINVSPTANAGADQTICYTGTATLNGSIGGGATSATWSSLGDGAFDDNTLLNAVYSPGPNDIISGTATLVLTSDFQSPCSSASDQMVLTVIHSVPPQPGPVTGFTPACPGNTLTYSIAPVAGAESYLWTPLNGTSSIVNGQGTTSVDILFGALGNGQSSYPLNVVAVNECGNSNPKSFSPRSKISVPSFSNGLPSVVCANTNGVNFSVTPVAGASTYTWTISGSGATIVGPANGTSVTVDFANFTTVTISVTATNACMTTAPRNKTITAAPLTPGIIQGPSYVCPNGTYTYSVPPVVAAQSYTWSGPPGAVVAGNGASVNITFGPVIPAGSLVTVIAAGSCNNNSPSRSKGIASGLPNMPSAITGPTSGQCGATGVSYSITPVTVPPIIDYTWSVNNGAVVSGPNNLSATSVDFPANFNTVTVSVVANSVCGSGPARSLVVNGIPTVPASITGNATPCAGSFETYCATGSAGATGFTWTIPPSWTTLNTTPPCITVITGSTGGAITVRATNACGNSAVRSRSINISCREAQVISSHEGMHVELYPNPAMNKSTLKFETENPGQYKINLIDLTGRTVLSTNGFSMEGMNMVELDLSSLAKGLYALQLQTGDHREVLRLVVE